MLIPCVCVQNVAALQNMAATKPARELYIGGIPPGTSPCPLRVCVCPGDPPRPPGPCAGITALQLQNVASDVIAQSGGALAPGNPVIGAWIAADGIFGFVEFRSGECPCVCMPVYACVVCVCAPMCVCFLQWRSATLASTS